MIKHFAIVMSVVALSVSSAFAGEKQSTVVNQALQQAAEDQTIFAEFLLGAESVREMSAQRALLVRIANGSHPISICRAQRSIRR